MGDDTTTRGRVPWGLRSRVSTLYAAKRARIMAAPDEVLAARFRADQVTADPADRWRRVDLGPVQLEVGFGGVFRMFGALIDLHWIARTGQVDVDDHHVLTYRFRQRSFHAGRSGPVALAERLSDARTAELTARSEVKSLTVTTSPTGAVVELVPLAGTITAMYVPPLPPYTVPVTPAESADHLDIVIHLCDLMR